MVTGLPGRRHGWLPVAKALAWRRLHPDRRSDRTEVAGRKRIFHGARAPGLTATALVVQRIKAGERAVVFPGRASLAGRRSLRERQATVQLSLLDGQLSGLSVNGLRAVTGQQVCGVLFAPDRFDP